jgi:hypothetical protein
MEFKKLHFGMAAAETEAAQEPDLLVEGYYHPHGPHDLPRSLMNGSPFLISGTQGFPVPGFYKYQDRWQQ